MTYIHELSDWPKFRWDDSVLAPELSRVRHLQGRLTGRMESLGFRLRQESVLRTLTEEVVKSSEIEGEKLDSDEVRSSLARRLGMDVAGMVSADRNVEGVVEMMIDATQNYDAPLTEDRLFGWHAALFPTGRSGMRKIVVGGWRDDGDGPMQVVSGPVARERVHYVAPAALRLEQEMSEFLKWFETTKSTDPVLDAGIAHLWFVTIHPFDDGNGRIARSVADLALARSEKSPQRFYSMSSRIQAERNRYYDVLEATQKGGLDITTWLRWFLDCLENALNQAEDALRTVVEKAHFWERIKNVSINDRQRKMLNRLLDGFEGKLNLSRWAALTKTSKATAGRDLEDLLRKGVLVQVGSGRSTSYELASN
ncbi:MAG: Fic family protein [Pyrinomonadaceae bacterium]